MTGAPFSSPTASTFDPTHAHASLGRRTVIARRQGEGLAGIITVPGDKSISHRALMLAGVATGETVINGLLESEDVLATAKAVEALGATIIPQEGATWRVFGRGVGGLSAPRAPLDLGNSGTGARLLMGLIAGHDMTATLTGDGSLCRRPMARILSPLAMMGASYMAASGDRLPLTLRGTQVPLAIDYVLPVPSAQVKSAILLAALNAMGDTTILEPEPTRDHTEKMLRHFGAAITIEETPAGRRNTLHGAAELTGVPVHVPGDPSSAAFPIVAALITPGSEIVVQDVLINPLRTGLYQTLEQMGADITFENEREIGGEKIADIRACASTLRGVEVPAERAPSMIDEYPILAVAAAFAEGETKMTGLAELRVKESDRLSAITTSLHACGVPVNLDGDDLTIQGCKTKTNQNSTVPGGATITANMDHRIAMAFLTLGAASDAPVQIDDGATIATSFPGFVEKMQSLGMAMEESTETEAGA